MENLTFELVQAIEEHARLLHAWRNDPLTRQMSYYQESIPWDHYWPRFRERLLQYPQLPSVFVLRGGVRVAYLGFQPVADPLGRGAPACDISINMAPAYRRQGLARPMLQQALSWLKHRGITRVVAEIKPENEASIQAFGQAGFKFLDEIEKVLGEGSCRAFRYVAECIPDFTESGSVYVIAEAGSNWRVGSPKRDRLMARALIDVALEAGANAVKFQTYRPDTVYVANAGASDYLSENGIQDDIREIFADLAMPYEMVAELADYARKQGLDFMSTPFSIQDFEAVDPHVRIHKIASYEISHLRLLERAAQSGKPLVLSTGASTPEDIAWAVETFYAHGGQKLCLLQCTAKYPAPLNSLNLNVIPWLRQRFGVAVGLSDHSREPLYAPTAAVALGASVIEKHYTLDNRLPGPDHAFALLPEELKQMVTAIRAAEHMRGTGLKTIASAEHELSTYARRGIQATRAISKGESLQEGRNIAILRPGKQRLGLHPRWLAQMEGQTASRDIPLGDGIQAQDWSSS